MKNPYRMRLDGESAAAVFMACASVSASELQRQADELEGNEPTQMGILTAEGIHGSSVEHMLTTGFALLMYRELTRNEEKLFMNLLEEVGQKNTQAYRTIGATEKFGPVLAKYPELTKRFVVEALKLLSEPRVPDSAREEAIAEAMSGKKVNIRIANEIRERHGVAPAEKKEDGVNTNSSQAAPKKRIANAASNRLVVGPIARKLKKPRKPWLSLIGKALSFVVEIKPDQKEPDLSVMIADTARFLDRLKQAHAALTQNNTATKVG